MKKIKVVVLSGGKSSEHEVSLASGKEIVAQLNKNKYEVIPLIIPKTGEGIEKILEIKPDLVYIAMHGPFGEDGKIQGLLETFGFKYTGPGVLSSAIGMDKVTFRKVMIAENISVPKFVTFTKGESLSKIHDMLGEPPYFVKPFDQGSSVGASVVNKSDELINALKYALKYSQVALVDEYIEGIELTCAVIGNEVPVALPIIEIRALKGNFFDYESKYTNGGANEIVPAQILDPLTKEIQEMAIKVYKSIGCRGVSRIDFILKDGKKPIVLEINTSPGMTRESLLPKAAKAAGLSYSRLLDKIIQYAIEK